MSDYRVWRKKVLWWDSVDDGLRHKSILKKVRIIRESLRADAESETPVWTTLERETLEKAQREAAQMERLSRPTA